MRELGGEVDGLRASVVQLGEVLSSADAQVAALEASEAQGEAELMSLLGEARAERDAMCEARAAAEHRAAEAARRLSEAQSDLEAAKVRGAGGAGVYWVAGGNADWLLGS